MITEYVAYLLKEKEALIDEIKKLEGIVNERCHQYSRRVLRAFDPETRLKEKKNQLSFMDKAIVKYKEVHK